MSKSILRPPSSDNLQQQQQPSDSAANRRTRLKWDEEVIQSHDAERGKRTKITEPKTPFIHYNQETDQVLNGSAFFDVPQMDLNSELEKYKPEDFQHSSISLNSMSTDGSGRRKSGGWESSDAESVEGNDPGKKKDFAKKRAQHYHMAEAMRTARKLIASGDELDDGDDDDTMNGEPVLKSAPTTDASKSPKSESASKSPTGSMSPGSPKHVRIVDSRTSERRRSLLDSILHRNKSPGSE